jgi:hypothetical protein
LRQRRPAVKSKRKSKRPVVSAGQIESCILMIRGHKVILDSDLAGLYGVETRALNQAVRRNHARFPRDFAFQLTDKELRDLMSQNVISSSGHGGVRKRPWVFTEHGAIMAANLLNSERAIQVSVFVVRAFVRLREVLVEHRELVRKISQLERRIAGHDQEIQTILEAIRQLMEPSPADPKPKIGFGVRERPVRYAARRKK